MILKNIPYIFEWLEPNPPIEEVINSGVIPRLIQFLQREENHVLQVILIYPYCGNYYVWVNNYDKEHCVAYMETLHPCKLARTSRQSLFNICMSDGCMNWTVNLHKLLGTTTSYKLLYMVKNITLGTFANLSFLLFETRTPEVVHSKTVLAKWCSILGHEHWHSILLTGVFVNAI